MRALIVLIVIPLAACSTATPPIPPSSIKPPSARLLEPPKELPPVAPGDSLYTANAQCRAEYGALALQTKGLQNWTSAVTRSRR
jgi:hypothetical protein